MVSWEFSHNQEDKIMTHEEKVLYLFKLSVDTATQYKVASLGSRGPSGSSTLEEMIGNIYKKLEPLLEEKLKSESGQ